MLANLICMTVGKVICYSLENLWISLVEKSLVFYP